MATAAQDYDIAISAIDTATEEGPEKLVSLIEEWYRSENHIALQRGSTWLQNIHFLAGDQWLRWNSDVQRWQSIPVTRSNQSIDRPVSNYTLVYTNANLSSFTSKPITHIEPNSDDPRDKTSANVANVVNEMLWEDNDKQDQYDEAALWGLTTSIAFRKSCKISTGKKIRVPLEPDDPKYAAMIAKGIEKPHKVVMQKKVHTEIISPFNLTFDGMGKRFKDIGVIMETQIRRLDWFKQNYGKDHSEIPGYTGEGDSVVDEAKLTNFVGMGESLRDIVEGSGSSMTSKSNEEIKDANIAHEVYVRPTKKHPSGRMIVIGGGKLLYDSANAEKKKSPYFYLEGKFWHPYTEWIFQKLPGSVYGVSLVQQLVPKQRSVNSIDALVAYNRKTVAVGQWLIPDTANLPDESIVGKPGQNIPYRPGPRGEKPEKTDGTPLPAQVMQERQNHLEDMDRIANSADVRSGINPKGVTTVGQLQILNENANRNMSKPVDRWEKFIERSEQLDLLNFQDCYRIPDPQMTSKLQNLAKDITNHDWQSFLGEQIRDNVNVRVEKGSTLAKSQIVMQETILSLAREGLLPDVVNDPYQHKLLLGKFGLTDLFTESNIDVKKAEKAIEMMLDGQYPPVEDYDNPDIQLLVLARYMKRPKFMDLEPKLKLLFKRRWDEYIQKLREVGAVPDTEETPNAGPVGAGASSGGGSAAGKPAKGSGPKAKSPGQQDPSKV